MISACFVDYSKFLHMTVSFFENRCVCYGLDRLTFITNVINNQPHASSVPSMSSTA